MEDSSKLILLTGATGYVGGRLCPRLLRAGYRVRVLTRSVTKLKSRPWADSKRLEIVKSNLEDVESLNAAMKDVDEAYYLVHSMQAVGSSYAQHDEKLARQVKLNMHIPKKIELKNTRSALRKATLDPVFNLIFGVLMLCPLVPFIYNHIQQLQYAGPAIGLALYALLLVIDSISRLSIIDAIDYDGPVMQIQQQVERLSIHNLRYTLPLNLSWGALWLFVPIVCLKALGDFDFYSLHQG